MAVTLDQIKDLRAATGVSMMACKVALEEAKGDFETAVDILRKKGEAKSAARALRETKNGVIAVKIDGGKGVLVDLQCETDFVSRGEEFVKLGDDLAEKLLKGEIKVSDRDVTEVKDAAMKFGENVLIANMELVNGDVLGSYVHSNKRIGVVVALKGGSTEVAKDVAMHIAATNPQFVSPDEVSQELVDREKGIWAEQLKSEGKPAEIVEKIMMGKEKKYREENALLKQVFVKDPDKTIEQVLKSAGATVEKFVRFAI